MNEEYENDISGQEVLLKIPHKHALYLFSVLYLNPSPVPSIFLDTEEPDFQNLLTPLFLKNFNRS